MEDVYRFRSVSDGTFVHIFDGGDVRGTDLDEIVSDAAVNYEEIKVICGKKVYPISAANGAPSCSGCIKAKADMEVK